MFKKKAIVIYILASIATDSLSLNEVGRLARESLSLLEQFHHPEKQWSSAHTNVDSHTIYIRYLSRVKHFLLFIYRERQPDSKRTPVVLSYLLLRTRRETKNAYPSEIITMICDALV